MIALFADVRSERHSDRNTTHTEKEWKRMKVREKGGITFLCAYELSPALIIQEGREKEERERETERGPPTWNQVESFRNSTKSVQPAVPAFCHPLCPPYKNDKTLFIKLPWGFELAPFPAHES